VFDGQFYPYQPIQFMDGLLYPIIGAVGGSPPTTLTFVGSTTSSTSSISLHGSAAAGDLAILIDAAWGDTEPAEVNPWTQSFLEYTAIGASSRGKFIINHRVLTAGDITAGSATGMNDDRDVKIMLIFHPDNPITTVTPASWDGHVTSNAPSVATIASGSGAVPLVVIGMAVDGDTATAPAFSVASPAFDAQVTATGDVCGMRVGYKVYNSSPANHDVDMADAGAVNMLGGGYLSVS
jgi:hypothetical protein